MESMFFPRLGARIPVFLVAATLLAGCRVDSLIGRRAAADAGGADDLGGGVEEAGSGPLAILPAVSVDAGGAGWGLGDGGGAGFSGAGGFRAVSMDGAGPVTTGTGGGMGGALVAGAGGAGGMATDGAIDASPSPVGNRGGTSTVDAAPLLPVIPGWLQLVAGGLSAAENAGGNGEATRFDSLEGMVGDGKGNLFIADPSSSTIRKFEIATKTISTFAGSSFPRGSDDGVGRAARFDGPVDVTTDGLGNLFVADRGNGAIRKIVIATGVVTTIAGTPGQSGVDDGVGPAARFGGLMALVSDRAGNLFVVDAENYLVRKIVVATGEVTTVAGQALVSGHEDGTSTAARFSLPSDIATDDGGNLYVVDYGGHTLRKIVIATGVVTTVAGTPGQKGHSDGVGAAALFNEPLGIAYDGAGGLFIADSGNSTLRRFDIGTGIVTTFAGSPTLEGYFDGIGTTARFGAPANLAVDEAGNLFLDDLRFPTLRKVVIATRAVTTVAGVPPTYGSVDGVGAAARFSGPTQAVSDGAGNLYVSDFNNHTIRKVTIATGEVTTLAGSAPDHGSADGAGVAARFYFPAAVALDGSGNLFVADSMNHTIRKLVLATGEVSTFAGSPEAPGREDGIGRAARFREPRGLVADREGNLFVSDPGNFAIRKVVIASAMVSTIAGGSYGSGDGTGAAAQFDRPGSLASDGAGNLYVTEPSGCTVRKIVLATGVVSTIAGMPWSYSYRDGMGIAASFATPNGVTHDGSGNLYVADGANQAIRKVALATGAVTTVIGVAGHEGAVLGPLPATLHYPKGVTFVPPADLLILDEDSVLVAHLPRNEPSRPSATLDGGSTDGASLPP